MSDWTRGFILFMIPRVLLILMLIVFFVSLAVF